MHRIIVINLIDVVLPNLCKLTADRESDDGFPFLLQNLPIRLRRQSDLREEDAPIEKGGGRCAGWC